MTGAITYVRAILMVAVVAGASTVAAQNDLLVTNAPFAPAASATIGGTPFAREIACFRFAASNGNADISALQLTTGGNGNWAGDLDATIGVEAWVDDGDQSFNAGTDTRVAFAPGAAPNVALTLSPTVSVASTTSADIWIVINALATAGNSIPDTFTVAIAAVTDVSTVAAATVTLGAPSPVSTVLSVVEFFVTSFSPTKGWTQNNIVIVGSGFTSPISLQIGPATCAGTAIVSANGTMITGLYVPPPSDGTLAIVLDTGLLPPITLTQTFKYENPSRNGDGNDCTTSADRSVKLLVLLACLLSLSCAARVARALD